MDKNYLDLYNLQKTLIDEDFGEDEVDIYCPR